MARTRRIRLLIQRGKVCTKGSCNTLLVHYAGRAYSILNKNEGLSEHGVIEFDYEEKTDNRVDKRP